MAPSKVLHNDNPGTLGTISGAEPHKKNVLFVSFYLRTSHLYSQQRHALLTGAIGPWLSMLNLVADRAVFVAALTRPLPQSCTYRHL